MASQICYDGPDQAEVYTNKKDGSSFTEPFPWELTNTDYFRRVVAQVGYSLQPLVEATVKAHGVVDVDVQDPKKRRQLEAKFTKNGFRVVTSSSGAIVFKSQNPRGQIGVDAFLLMKHILFDRGTTCHTTFYVTQMSAACPTLTVGDLKGDLKSVPPPPPNWMFPLPDV